MEKIQGQKIIKYSEIQYIQKIIFDDKYKIYTLNIQALPGTEIVINNTQNIKIGSSGIFKLKKTIITSLIIKPYEKETYQDEQILIDYIGEKSNYFDYYNLESGYVCPQMYEGNTLGEKCLKMFQDTNLPEGTTYYIPNGEYNLGLASTDTISITLPEGIRIVGEDNSIIDFGYWEYNYKGNAPSRYIVFQKNSVCKNIEFRYIGLGIINSNINFENITIKEAPQRGIMINQNYSNLSQNLIENVIIKNCNVVGRYSSSGFYTRTKGQIENDINIADSQLLRNIKFINCMAEKCTAGFVLHNNFQRIQNIEFNNCLAINNRRSGFHCEYRTLCENVIYNKCRSYFNGLLENQENNNEEEYYSNFNSQCNAGFFIKNSFTFLNCKIKNCGQYLHYGIIFDNSYNTNIDDKITENSFKKFDIQILYHNFPYTNNFNNPLNYFIFDKFDNSNLEQSYPYLFYNRSILRNEWYDFSFLNFPPSMFNGFLHLEKNDQNRDVINIANSDMLKNFNIVNPTSQDQNIVSYYKTFYEYDASKNQDKILLNQDNNFIYTPLVYCKQGDNVKINYDYFNQYTNTLFTEASLYWQPSIFIGELNDNFEFITLDLNGKQALWYQLQNSSEEYIIQSKNTKYCCLRINYTINKNQLTIIKNYINNLSTDLLIPIGIQNIKMEVLK